MAHKEKAARAATRTALDTVFDTDNSTSFDPVKGWYSLAQTAKERQQNTPNNTGIYGKEVKR